MVDTGGGYRQDTEDTGAADHVTELLNHFARKQKLGLTLVNGDRR